MTVYPIQATFSRGELTPRLHARSDIQDYAQSLAICRNWIVMRHGGLRRRSGFVWISNVRNSSAVARLFEFEFNEEQAYCLCFNGGYIRFYTLGGEVRQTGQTITGITKANPAVVTYSGSDTYADGDRVRLSDIGGMVELNNREFEIASVDTGANTFELSGIDSSGYTTYTTGGTIETVYEIAHPYGDADLFDLQIAQAADTVYISHPDYAPMKLVRSSETSWAISEVEFDNGPYMDEETQGTTLTPASSGAITPKMTGNTAPSGTASASDSGSDAFEVFDLSDTTTDSIASTSGSWTYDFPSTNTKIADAYWIRAGTTPENTPAAWSLQGYDGSNWITLDTRADETVWGRKETRFFSFKNATAYQQYRLSVRDVDGGSALEIAQLGIHEDGDSQTAFNLTASAVTGINGGAGFKTTDVGRTIRLLDEDGYYRWARIVSRTSSTIVTIRLYGHSLSTLNAIAHWQMSSWSVDDGFPAAVGFYQDRLGWGGSDSEPLKLWLSRSSDYENHGTSEPVIDTDGINIRMTGGFLNRIAFIEEMDPLICGTAGTMRVVGPLDSSSGLASTNIQQKPNGKIGAAAIQPLNVGLTLIFVDRYRKRAYEFAFDLNANAYVPKELSIESDHLLLSGVTDAAFQQDPDNLCLFTLNNGRVASLTYEQTQRVAGWTDMRIAGGGTDDADCESVASIPSAGGDVTYAIVNRTIGGATVRSIEYTAPVYETGDAVEDAFFFDAAGGISGSSMSGVSGLWRLRSESVGVLADGVDIGDVTISATGVLTLPASVGTADTIVYGKRYTSYAESLRAPRAGNQDGSALGRRMAISEIRADLLDTAGLYVGTPTSTRLVPGASRTAADGTLYTGVYAVPTADSHDNDGVFVFSTDRGYPATVRAIQIALEGEP